MKIRTAVLAFVFTVGCAGVTSSNADEATDEISASFDRAFNHEPAAAPAPARFNADDDVLYLLINEPLQTADDAPQAAAAEQQDDEPTSDDVVMAKGE